MPDFSKRSTQLELMDDMSIPEEDLYQNLAELEVVNTRLGGYGVVLKGLQQLIQKYPTQTNFSLADAGCGGGDTLRKIEDWAKKKSYTFDLHGIDYQTAMINYATKNSLNYNIQYWQSDIFEHPKTYDVVVCSLFCHHFEHQSLLKLLQSLYEKTNKLLIINDLHRHFLAYYSIKFLTRLLRGSYLVQHDAPLSVLRGFKQEEWLSIFQQAHLPMPTIRWKWAFRHQILLWK